MKLILKALREGLGRLVILVDWIFSPSIIKRNDESQAKTDQLTKDIKLYQFYACPFCTKTRRTIKRLNLKIETRNAQEGEYRDELKLKGGQIKVPCLKIEYAGEISWLYNSNDIIDYLCERFS